MEVFKELKVSATYSALEKFANGITNSLPSGWQQYQKKPKVIVGLGDDAKSYAFTRAKTETEPESHVHLLLHGNTLQVSNITPSEASKEYQLSIAQYNNILSDFSKNILEPQARAAGFLYEETGADLDITHWITEKAARLLLLFSECANKSTGASHPNDFARWTAFLIQVHRDGSSLGTDLLGRWLVKELGWSEDIMHDLVSQYDFAMSLLENYDKAQ